MGVVVLDVRLLVALSRVAEENPRPRFPVFVEFQRREVVEKRVPVGEDRWKQLPEIADPDLPFDRVEQGDYFLLGGVLDDVQKGEGYACHRQNEDLLVGFTGGAQKIHLEIIGYPVLVAVYEPIRIQMPGSVRFRIVLVFVFLLVLPLFQRDLPREMMGFDGVNAFLDSPIQGFFRAAELFPVRGQHVMDGLAFVDDSVSEDRVLDLIFLVCEIRPFPRSCQPVPGHLLGGVRKIRIMFQWAIPFFGAAVADEREPVQPVAGEFRVFPAFGDGLASVASLAAAQRSACLFDGAASFVKAASAKRPVVFRFLGFGAVPFQFAGNRSRVHAQSVSDFLCLVAFGDHSRKRGSFFNIECHYPVICF